MLGKVTLQNEFYNIFAYTAVRGSRWSLACGVTIRPLEIEFQLSHYFEKSNFGVCGSFIRKS